MSASYRRAIVCVLSAALAVLLYALSSGPALLLAHTRAWYRLKLDVIYWPLSRAAATSAYKVLLPYWDLFHPDRDENPLIAG